MAMIIWIFREQSIKFSLRQQKPSIYIDNNTNLEAANLELWKRETKIWKNKGDSIHASAYNQVMEKNNKTLA